MLNKLLEMVRRYDMLQEGDRVICAVSGGADSVALLFALYLLKEKLQIRLEAAHFNHHLRGEESDRDEAFVRDICDRWDIPLHVSHGSIVAGEKGLEAAARDARYAFLDTLGGKIATAHTADDNAETVLMHLVRGTGLKGLGAISPVRGNLIRPLLLATRQQVMEFIAEYNLSYVEDSSNETDAFLRNRLRHHVMPLLKQENPRLCQNLSAMALRLRQDEEALQQLQDFSEGLDVAATLAQEPAFRSRTLEAFLKHCGVKEPDAAHISQAQALLESKNPSAKAAFPGGVTVARRYDKLVCLAESSPLTATELACPGVTELPEQNLRIICSYTQTLQNDESTYTVSASLPIFARGREAGDSIRLSGGRKSLKKLFIDRKIPADQRNSFPVLADRNGILAVYQIGADRDRIAKECPAVQIKIEEIHSKEKNM